MGRTLENKQQIVGELKELLADAELALVLDYKGLSIKEMSDLRGRLQASNSVCKVTKNTLMRRAIDGDSSWANLDSLLTCLLYTSPSPRDRQKSRMPSSA